MNRFTLLLLIMIIVGGKSLAQISPVPNTFIKHSESGSITQLVNYDNGIMFISSNGTNDNVVYSFDGETFTNLENLSLGTGKNLKGWNGSKMAFYYGDNTTDGVGTDLRVNDNGSGRLLWNESGGHDPANPAKTNVLRVDYGIDGYRYYYAFGADYHPITGLNIKLYESDGTDFGTMEVSNALNDDPFDPQPIEIKTTSAIDNGLLEGVMFNGKLHFIAGYPGSLGNHFAIYYIDFDPAGSTAGYLVENESEVSGWANIVATSNYMYVCTDTDGLFSIEAIDASGNKYLVNNGTNLKFSLDKPVVANDKVYAITQDPANGNKKLAIIHSPTNVELIDITGVDNDDNVSHLTVVNNKLFFFANDAGSSDRYLYTLRTDIANAEILKGKIVYASAEITSVSSVEDGIVYATWTESFSSGSVTVFEGYSGTAYQLVMSDQSFGWPNKISNISTNGNDIYLCTDILDASDNVVSTDIYKATHILPQTTKPNPVPLNTYYRGNFIFNITDINTTDPIEGVQVTIVNPLEEFQATSNASGQGMFAWKPCEYYKFKLEAVGYETIEYDQWATIWIPNVNFSPYAERDVQMTPIPTGIGDVSNNFSIYPNPAHDILNIKSGNEIVAFELYSISGNKVLHVRKEGIRRIDVSSIPAGVYVAIVSDIEGQTKTIKITKR